MFSGDYEPVVSCPRKGKEEIPFWNGSPEEAESPAEDPTEGLVTAHRNDDEWRCVDCGTDWPCVIFRRRMRALYAEAPDRLRTFMRHFRDRAAADLGDLTPAQLDARFLGWTEPDPPLRQRMRSIRPHNPRSNSDHRAKHDCSARPAAGHRQGA